MAQKAKMPWDAIPGGRYIQGGTADEETGKHYGGRVVNAHGDVLHEFKDNEENPGHTPEDAAEIERRKAPAPPAPPKPAAK